MGPLVQFPTLYHQISKCLDDNCEHVMERKEWQNGQNTNSLPRLIHGIDGIVLLASRMYVCGLGHRFLSHDERILSRFPSQAQIPFLLSHKSGLTMQCVSLVVSLIGEGKKISSVENALRETRRETFYRSVLCSVKLTNKIAKSTSILKFENSINGMVCPGRKILLSVFLQNFWKHEVYYRRRMHEIGISEDWICCDHTFKSVMNVGIYQRHDNDDSKWVKQFKSLFIVLNDIGQVLSWQLADDTSHDTVHEALNEINQRLKTKTKTLKEIYVDDCCKLRNKLQSVFGKEVEVKLDIFHAIQRITKKTSKRHSLFYDFVASLKNVFRDSSDIGNSRQLPTPSPKDLGNNMDAFVKRWKDVKSHCGKIILTPQVLEEINKLRQHINRGCLSYIRPGRGTNRDESLHKRINNFMKYSKVGTELAYALLMSVFDRYNEDMKKPKDRKSLLQYLTEHIIEPNKEFVSMPPKFGLTTPPRDSCIELEEMEFNDDEDNEISDSHFIQLLENVKGLTLILNEIREKRLNRAIFDERYVPFMNSATSLFFHKKTSIDTEHEYNYDQHVSRLSAVVQGWGFQIQRCEGDGNCFFYSAAVALLNLEKDSSYSPILNNIGIEPDMSISEVACKLRELLVTEWTTHPERYQAFLSTPLENDAQLFLQSGHFFGELGNTMPLALANILSSPLILFTSLETMPVLLITPSVIQHATPRIHLAFNHYGVGHYDAVVFSDESNDNQSDRNEECSASSSADAVHKCSCGKNAKNDDGRHTACVTSNRYASRCPCYKNQRGCHNNCKCKYCENPFGGRGLLSQSTLHLAAGPSRKRIKHSLSTTTTPGKAFMEKMEVNVEKRWSPTEILIFECILQLLYSLNIPVTADNVKRYFNLLASRITELGFNFEMVKKTTEAITCQIKKHNKALQAWLSGYVQKHVDEDS